MGVRMLSLFPPSVTRASCARLAAASEPRTTSVQSCQIANRSSMHPLSITVAPLVLQMRHARISAPHALSRPPKKPRKGLAFCRCQSSKFPTAQHPPHRAATDHEQPTTDGFENEATDSIAKHPRRI